LVMSCREYIRVLLAAAWMVTYRAWVVQPR
jgi:hypothetical protein